MFQDFLARFVLVQRGALLRYGVAVGLALGSLLLVRLLNGVEGTQLSSLAVASVVLSGLYGGLGPALLDAAITAIGIDYFYSEPLSRVFDSWGSIFRVLTYGAIGALIAGVVASLRDAHRRLHAQYQQAERAKRARENTLAIVSHDLRSPLSAVLLGIAYLRRAASEGKTLQSVTHPLDAIHRSADSMRRLVDDLLEAAKIESGQFRIEPARQRLLPIVEDAVEAGRPAADAKRMRIELAVPESEPVVHGDRQRLTQVLSNLIGNAVKFSPEGTPVEVRVQVEDEWLRIEVADRGPGIAREHLPHVFTRFWQATDTARLGTGLGLFIAKSIVESHGGRIAVASEPGRGSRFTVHLRKAAD